LSRLRLDLKPSPALAVVIVAAHAAGTISILLALPTTAGFLLAGSLLALGVAAAWSRALLRSPMSVRALEIGDETVLQLASGASLRVDVAERRYVTRFMVALPIRRPMGRTVLITADMLGSDAFRALRVWALWGKLPAATAKPSNAEAEPAVRKQLPA
jgi:hypothetical protein